MNRYLAVLRGINVGGHKKILMADLKNLFVNLGYDNVITYIQSGNVIFNSKYDKNVLEIASHIEDGIKEKFGYEVPVIVIKKDDIIVAIDSNPYIGNYEIEKLCITFLKGTPDKDLVDSISNYDVTPDIFEIIGKWIFICCFDSYHKSKVTNNFLENKLKVAATTRNWKTVLKLAEILED